jgi:hypothetical protein
MSAYSAQHIVVHARYIVLAREGPESGEAKNNAVKKKPEPTACSKNIKNKKNFAFFV